MSYGVPLRSLPRSKEAAQDLRHALAEAVPQAHVDFFRPAPCITASAIISSFMLACGPGIALDRQNPPT